VFFIKELEKTLHIIQISNTRVDRLILSRDENLISINGQYGHNKENFEGYRQVEVFRKFLMIFHTNNLPHIIPKRLLINAVYAK